MVVVNSNAMGGLSVIVRVLAVISAVAATGLALDGDCIVSFTRPPVAVKLTVHDVDETCCSQLQQGKGRSFPECSVGKSFEADGSLGGGVCAGSLCHFPVPPQPPHSPISFTSWAFYNLSDECCTSLQTHPASAQCPGMKACAHEEGSIVGTQVSLASFGLAFTNSTFKTPSLCDWAA